MSHARALEPFAVKSYRYVAPIVAFVPTSPPSRACSSVEVVVRDAEPFIDNNVLALAWVAPQRWWLRSSLPE